MVGEADISGVVKNLDAKFTALLVAAHVICRQTTSSPPPPPPPPRWQSAHRAVPLTGTEAIVVVVIWLKGNTKSDDNWAHKPSKCVKNSVCFESLCPSDCKKIKFISPNLPVPGRRHVDARASFSKRIPSC